MIVRERLNLLTPTRFSTPAVEAPPTAEQAAATVAALPGGVIDGGEIVILAIKPSMWRPLLDSASWLVTSVLLAGVLIALNQPVPGFSLIATAQLVLLVGLARLGLAIMRWVPTWYVLTNRRALKVHGIRSPRASACMLNEIQQTRLDASLAQKLTRLGTITFLVKDAGAPPLLWRSVSQPELVHAKVRRAIDNAAGSRGKGA